jgi:hypothetical protein
MTFYALLGQCPEFPVRPAISPCRLAQGRARSSGKHQRLRMCRIVETILRFSGGHSLLRRRRTFVRDMRGRDAARSIEKQRRQMA